MFSKSSKSLHQFSGIALALLFLGSFCCGAAEAQTTPIVTPSVAQGLDHPGGWGLIEQTAIDSYGDWVVVDYANGGVYEFPQGGGAAITLLAPGNLGGGYENPAVAIDPGNNLYLGGNWNNCLLEYPYNAATQTWTGLSAINSKNTTPDECGVAPEGFAQYGVSGVTPGYFQPWGIAIGNNNNLVIGNQNSSNFIFTLGVNGAWASPRAGSATTFVYNSAGSALTERPSSVAQDKFGNVYFVEDPTNAGSLPGVYEIPASVISGVAAGTQSPLTTDAGLTRVDPDLPSVSGVITDPSGNLYVSDGQKGVFLIPNPSGTPETSSAVLLSSVPAQGEVAIDWTRHILYVPTTQTQSNGQGDVAKVWLGAADLGGVAVGSTTTTPASIQVAVSDAPAVIKAQVVEAGVSQPDFAVVSGGTCAEQAVHGVNTGCTVDVAFTPHSAGSISAKLLLTDLKGNVLASMPLHGTGTSAAVQVEGGAQSAVGAGLKTPNQVAVDAAGNVYVADPGLGAVEEYPQGSGATAATVTVGTGLTAPTGVAVDGAGDVFIADSGTVYEVPEGPSGLNTAGQITLKTGLGSNLKLAVDGWDNLYIADPDNHRVVQLSNLGGTLGPLAQSEIDITGLNAPSAIAVDSSGNLYIADGSSLDEVPVGGTTPTTLLSSLDNATGLSVDASGAVYIAETGGTIRIPNESGTLNMADQTPIAANVSTPASVALDALGDVYVVDGTALNVNVTSASAAYNFGTLATATSTQSQTFTLVNNGNAALNVTGFSSTPDYSATATDCTGSAVAVGADCTVTVTFNPGPGDDGTLTGSVLAEGNVANAPVGINGTGVGVTLAASATTMASTAPPTTDDAPISVTVAASSGTGPTPTGNVTLTISAAGSTAFTQTVALTGGTVQFDPQNIPAGTYTFTAAYGGDRSYTRSAVSPTVTIAAGAVVMTQPATIPLESFTMPQSLQASLGSGTGYLVLCENPTTGCNSAYDGSDQTWDYTYPVTIAAANGSPLTCVPVYATVSGVQTLERENCGEVSYELASGVNDCDYAVSSSVGPVLPVDVSHTNGSAPMNTTCLEVNDSNTTIPDIMTFYTVTPVYSGADVQGDSPNPNYVSFTGTPISFWALRNPMVQISSSSPSLTVGAGSSTQTTLTLTSVLGYGYVSRGSTLNNYSLPLDLSCDGLPAYATCTFTYSAPIASDPNPNGVACPPGSTTQYCAVNVGPTPGITLSGGSACSTSDGCIGPGTVTMTISANVSTGASASLRTDSGDLAFAAMFGLGLFGLTFRKKARRWSGFLLLACVLLCGGGMVGITACGTTNLSPGTANTTPAGTYNVTVTAKETGSIQVTVNGAIETVYGNSNQMSLPYTIPVTFAK
ncbi:MAG: Ig-like domain repeat protein [Acidobacteriaceae bacterium]